MLPQHVFQRYQDLQDYVGWTSDDAARVRALAPFGHGGTITVRSAPSSGAEFEITLPRKLTQQSDVPSPLFQQSLASQLAAGNC